MASTIGVRMQELIHSIWRTVIIASFIYCLMVNSKPAKFKRISVEKNQSLVV